VVSPALIVRPQPRWPPRPARPLRPAWPPRPEQGRHDPERQQRSRAPRRPSGSACRRSPPRRARRHADRPHRRCGLGPAGDGPGRAVDQPVSRRGAGRDVCQGLHLGLARLLGRLRGGP